MWILFPFTRWLTTYLFLLAVLTGHHLLIVAKPLFLIMGRKKCECVWSGLWLSWSRGDGGVVVMNQSPRNKCSLAQHRHLCHHHRLCLLSCLPPLCHHHPVILPAPVHHAQHKSKHFISIISQSRRITIFLGILLAYKTLWWSFQGLTMSSVHFPE